MLPSFTKKSVRPAVYGLVVGAALLFLLFVPGLQAEKTTKPRKIVTQVQPEYPPDLKRALIGGVVRLDIVVNPHGNVEFLQVVGGNPILVEAAIQAVKKWKYAPSSSTTSMRVNVNFDPTR